MYDIWEDFMRMASFRKLFSTKNCIMFFLFVEFSFRSKYNVSFLLL